MVGCGGCGDCGEELGAGSCSGDFGFDCACELGDDGTSTKSYGKSANSLSKSTLGFIGEGSFDFLKKGEAVFPFFLKKSVIGGVEAGNLEDCISWTQSGSL